MTTSTQRSNNTCPQCMQIDMVRKVSAIVTEGTTSTTGLIEHRNSASFVEETSQSQLAAKLQLPPRPIPPDNLFLSLLGKATILIVTLPFSCYIGYIVTQILHLQGLLWIFAIILMLFVIPFGVFKGVSKIKDKIPTSPKMIAFLEAEQYWQRLNALWEELFYCRRCDVVYLPNSGDHASASNLIDYLYFSEALRNR